MEILKKLKKGTITIEVRAMIPEKFINLLWSHGIYSKSIRKLDLTTFLVEVNLGDLKEVQVIAKRINAKVKVVGKKGLAFYIIRAKRQVSLCVAAIIFLGVIFYLSTYIWSVEINTKRILSPFEVRRQLNALNIKPGVKKTSLDVYALEKQLEDTNGDIMWVKARIEGSTLKVDIEEKVNPPEIKEEENNEGIIAKMDGVIQRIYTISGTAVVKPGDIVKAGDLLIKPYQGKEGLEYQTKAEGKVIANTAYEKILEVQVSGKLKERTGEKDKAIYIEVLGKKIYLKKPIKMYEDYDKIEVKDNFIKNEVYYEIAEKELNLNEDEVKLDVLNKSRQAVLKEIDKKDTIVQEIQDVENIGDGKIIIKNKFIVEQDISQMNN